MHVFIVVTANCVSWDGTAVGSIRQLCFHSIFWTDRALNLFLARDVIYTSRAYATMSVSVCLWRKCIGALQLISVSNSDPTLPRIAATVLLAGGSSRAMLASARLHCCLCMNHDPSSPGLKVKAKVMVKYWLSHNSTFLLSRHSLASRYANQASRLQFFWLD